ncbi:Small RNA degrading nuclease 2, partial [Glycine soja]
MFVIDCEMVLNEDKAKALVKAVLHREVKEKGVPHNCLDDVCASMGLFLVKIEHVVDIEFPILLVQEHVLESEMSRLLRHKIPNTVNNETLHKIVLGDFKIELKPSRRGQGVNYSALEIFKIPQEADEAYENVQGSQLK